LTTLDMIKTEALLIEFKEEKKESFYKWWWLIKGTGKPGTLSLVTKHLWTIWRSGKWKPRNQRQLGIKCSFCHKTGHTIDECWVKHNYPGSHSGKPKKDNNTAILVIDQTSIQTTIINHRRNMSCVGQGTTSQTIFSKWKTLKIILRPQATSKQSWPWLKVLR
jgi:hypothetical protein